MLEHNDSFILTLMSNDTTQGIGYHNHNSLTHFENTLQYPIKLGEGKWVVGVKTFFCHNQFKDNKADFLNISCSLITPKQGQINSILQITRPKKKRPKELNPKIFYEAEIVEFHPVNCTHLSTIEIDIFALNTKFYDDCTNKLYSGQPTILTLEFKRDYPMSNTPEAITVQSIPTANWPDNTCASFSVDLGPAYTYNPNDGELEVSVSSISYQPQFQLTTEDHLEVKIIDPNNPKNVIYKIKVKEFLGNSADSYIFWLNDTVFHALSKAPNSPKIECLPNAAGILALSYSNANIPQVIIQLPFSMMYNMGERNFVPLDGISRTDASSNYSYQLIIKNESPVTLQVPPNPNAFMPETGFVLCDFAKYTPMGSNLSPIIKVFPMEAHNAKGLYTTYTSKSELYYPVSKYDLSTVRFELVDSTGSPIPFKHKNSIVRITLLLRKKKVSLFNTSY